MANRSKRSGWWLVGSGLGALVLAGVGIAIFVVPQGGVASTAETAAAEDASGGKTDRAAQAVAVTVDRAATMPIQRRVSVVGTFNGYDEVTVMAEVTGRVDKILHDVGEVVRPGDLLLEIDPTDYELAVQETRRALELEATRIGLPIPAEKDFTPEKILAVLYGDKFDINKLPVVVRAKEQEDNAKARLERAKQLREGRTISQEEFDQRSTDYQVALTTRLQAQMDAQSVVAGIKHRLVLLRISERKLKLTRVVVPTPTKREGMPTDVEYAIAQRKVTEGEMVKDAGGASTAAFELVMDKMLKLVASVPERFVAQVRSGQPVEVNVEAYPGRVFAGKVVRISPMVDRGSRAFQVEIAVDNAKRELKAGGFAKADILTFVDPNALAVPLPAVASYAGSVKVFVVREGRAKAVPVMTGTEVRDAAGRVWVEVIQPDARYLRPGATVVTTGHDQLADDRPVSIRKNDAAAPKNDAAK